MKVLLLIASPFLILILLNTNHFGFISNINSKSVLYNIGISIIYIVCIIVIYKILRKEKLEGLHVIFQSKQFKAVLTIMTVIALIAIMLFAYEYKLMLETTDPLGWILF